MRLLHASDLHLVVNRYGERLDDYAEMLDRLATDAEEQDVAMTILSGDTFDSRRPGPDASGTSS